MSADTDESGATGLITRTLREEPMTHHDSDPTPPHGLVRLNAPLDRTHAECLAMRTEVNREFTDARRKASMWEPRPMPAGFGR